MRKLARIQSIGISEAGKKETNDDFLVIDPEIGLFILCDGMSPNGRTVAEVASTGARRYIRDAIALARAGTNKKVKIELIPLVRKAIEYACQRLAALVQSQREFAGTGTTMTLLLLDGTLGVMGHVGDSRLYMQRDGRLYQLSKDHSLVGELVAANEISAEDAARHPFSKVLTRALGRDESVKVDTLLFELLPGDTFLLCSNGLWRDSLAMDYLESDFSNSSLPEIANRLSQLSKKAAEGDNASSIVVRPEQAEEIVETERVRQELVTLRLDTLRKVDLFDELPIDSLFKLLDISRSKDCEPGELLIREGELSSSLYIILQGSVTVSHNGTDIASFSAGAHFGEMALLSSTKRSASVRSSSRSSLLVIDKDPLFSLLYQEPLLGVSLLSKLGATLSLRLHEMNKYV